MASALLTSLYEYSHPRRFPHLAVCFVFFFAWCLTPSQSGLFERGASSVGLDFLAHPFWDKYIEFEERVEAQDKIFAILGRIIHIPMHQYARYFERYRQLAQTRPLAELAPTETMSEFRSEIEAASSHVPPGAKAEAEIERDLRLRVDNYHLVVFSTTQTETTKRWTSAS
jgi:pre-mRNA-processing factor 39